MSYLGAKLFSDLTQIPIPIKHCIIKWKNHLQSISRKGGENRFIIYEKITIDEKYRAKKW